MKKALFGTQKKERGEKPSSPAKQTNSIITKVGVSAVAPRSLELNSRRWIK